MKIEQSSSYVSSQMMYSSQVKKQEEVQQGTFASQIKSKEDMSLDEYKAYFNEKMNSLYTHPSQRNRNDIIDITDAAYKRMQTDPEYEKKILDALAKNKAVNFGNYIPQISYMHIDDTWEGCYGYTQGMKENDSYIKGNSSKHENNVKKEKEQDREKEFLEEYIEKRIQVHRDMQELRTKEYFKHKEQNAELSRKALAAKAYEQQILEEH
ncbi:hypothetical protein [Agathobacter rectalis]|jgi:hypothetical protein|uniref:Uncharacterized protein n=1 Tax=Agathobacter rectalis TaxID=39491 RepID=A0A3E5AJ31_9FIRM|nr:hypothetical protein [Agathobacter rectalis]RGN12485.1 hypothetical protein DXB76_15795 [Agathobacter rectalis]RGN19077.1 hypothetical protein DXB72_15830 [Agathobacter rectalis]RGN20492.1 hypothetical protein DXB69_14415 [Agathobacter rectalis]